MEKIVIMLFVLLLVVFIGNVAYKESFADCNSAGQMTWTLTLSPESSSCGKRMNVTNPSGNADSVGILKSGSSSGLSSGGSSSGLSSGGSSSGASSSGGSSSGGSSSGVSPSGGSSSGVSSSSSPAVSSVSSKKPSGIELSLTDLMALIGSTKDSSGNCPKPPYNYRYVSASIPQPPAPPAPQVYVIAGSPSKSLNSQFHPDLRKNILDPVLRSYVDASGSLVGSDFQNNRIAAGSVAIQQGIQYVKGAPSNNPVDNPEYIRKDSIPCYACSP